MIGIILGPPAVALLRGPHRVSAEEPGGRAEAGARVLPPPRRSPQRTPIETRVFGELHLHTSWSFDAFAFQNTLVDPDVAYRFAKGESIRHINGEMVQRNTPLDFAVVTDHAEYMGVAQLLIALQ